MTRYLSVALLLAASCWAQTAAPCALQTTSIGWTFTGTGCACKYNAVAKVDDADLQSAGTQAAVFAKYGSSWTTWAQQQSIRLSNLGFNAVDQSSGRYQATSNWTNGNLWFSPSAISSGYMMQDNAQDGTGPVHVDDITRVSGVNLSGMKCGNNFVMGDQADPYHASFQSGMTTYLANSYFPHGGNAAHAWLEIPDEADFLYGIDQAHNPNNAHPDLALFLLVRPPFQVISNCSGCNNTGNTVFPDATIFAKTAFRDALKTEYGSSISALNTAWGTSYTTFDTSDAGGLTSIQTAGGNAKCTGSGSPYSCCTGSGSGTCTQYQSWGGNAACSASGNPYSCCSGNGTGSCTQGTGFLDEAGFGGIFRSGQSCGGASGNGPTETDNWGANTTIQNDARAFVAALAGKYAKELQTAYLSACATNSIAPCPPLVIPVYDGPWDGANSVYAAMAPYGDIFWINAAGFATYSAAVTEVQNIVNNDGGKPVIVANYDRDTPDSYINAACDAGAGQDCTSTQAAKATNYVGLDQGVLPLKNGSGKYAVIGLAHWSLYDNHTESRAFGLFSPNDNGYDGSQATTLSGTPSACITNHAYTAPAICADPNGNYESLRVASCTSAVSGTSWPSSSTANFQKQTTDGTCKWYDVSPGGTYALTAESSNWGPSLGAIADFNAGNLCDPPPPPLGTSIPSMQ